VSEPPLRPSPVLCVRTLLANAILVHFYIHDVFGTAKLEAALGNADGTWKPEKLDSAFTFYPVFE